MKTAIGPTSHFLGVFLAATLLSTPVSAQQTQAPDEMRGAPAEPTDAAEVRAQIAIVENLLPSYPDRGAALYFLAASKQHLGENLEALRLLKECIALREGFDPSDGPEYA
jgi:hypothetical protein